MDDITQFSKRGILPIQEAKKSLDGFLKRLSQKPKKALLKKNKFANNAEYLEIGYLQAELDRTFHGLWSWNIDSQEVVINGISVRGTLKVFHPVINQWLERSGIALKEFQLSAGKNDPTATNLSKKALERDVPIANAEAFKNACKTLGNAFGRHLNRKFQFEHIADENIINNLIPNKDE